MLSQPIGEPLKKVGASDDNMGSLLDDLLSDGNNKKSIEVKVLSSNANSMRLEVNLEGDFKDGSVLKGEVLSISKKRLEEVSTLKQDISGGSGSYEFEFEFVPAENKKYSKNKISSQYVKIEIVSKGDIFSDIGIGDLFGEPNLYTCKKQWELTGKSNSGILVEVNISPNGTKSAIRQTSKKLLSSLESKTNYKGGSSEDTKGEGPTNLSRYQINDHIDNKSHKLKGSLYSTIFRDNNPASGLFYYVPASYNLMWSSATEEYNIKVNYNSADTKNSTITAILSPSIDSKELEKAEIEIRSQLEKNNDQYGFKELMPIPLSESPTVNFNNQLLDISVRATSDITEPIDVTFTVSNVEDILSMLFENFGIGGNLSFLPEGKNMPDIKIPFNIGIQDKRTYGVIDLTNKNWKSMAINNKFDYPIQLNRLNIEILEDDGIATYSWIADNVRIPEHATYKLKSGNIPGWVNDSENVMKIWLDYDLLSCSSCNDAVRKKVTKGSKQTQIKNIEVFIVDAVFDETNANMINVKLRSKQAKANNSIILDLDSVLLLGPGKTEGGKLYVPEGESISYEYKLQIIRDDKKIDSDRWMRSSESDLFIGTSMIKKQFSNLNN